MLKTYWGIFHKTVRKIAKGEIVRKELSEQVHNCPHCGLVLDRDHNAAINILRRGLQSLRL
jgi:putative transposase